MGIFKDIKRKSKTPTIRLCPNCEQPTLARTAVGQFTNVDYFSCSNCNYQGSFYIEIELPQKKKDENQNLKSE
ncbi:hypothetical protein [Candidatus Harpocratesius sp.]